MKDYRKPVFCNKDKTEMIRNFKVDFGKQLFGDIWPFASYAAGVSPSEVPMMQKIDRENGVPTEYSSDGDPVFTSPAHRKKYCRAHGLYDRNAGYRDAEPINK